uniref:DNA polymerase n=2 Tax=Plectus sambesii TaxID=2011161 RepID=A0A914VI60_9BILA
MFSGIVAFVLPNGIGKQRRQLLENQLVKNGAALATDLLTATHVFADDDLPADRIDFATLPECVSVLRTRWISHSLKSKQRVTDCASYQIEQPVKKERTSLKHHLDDTESESKPNGASSKEEDAKDATAATTADTDGPSPTKRPRHFICETSSSDASAASQRVNHNEHITSQLQILADGYKSTNDKWRALSYEKAIETLKHLPRRIESREDCVGLRTIGARLAEKIWEICESGSLRKADEFAHNDKVVAMNLFANIWGVGPTVAEQWYVQGLRTLDDVREKAHLTRQQKIGLEHYDDINQRMPRQEATEIVNVVIDAIRAINPNLIAVACGSYRREKETCGDVDILITHKDGHSHENILGELVANLTQQGFLTDDLVESNIDGNQHKYMGLCRLPGENRHHRRIDIITIPYDQYATSLIYFTGSAHFTRSIYAKAKSMGMRLNQHGLRGGVMRQGGEQLNDGYPIETPTEESVFEALGLPYRTPPERDHP